MTAPVKNNTVYPLSQFTYDPKTGEFVTEASTLGLKPGKTPKMIMVQGTKKKVLYQIFHSNEQVTKYKPTTKSAEWTPSCVGTSLVIFNT